jgi:site-specific recombinase XerD
MRKESYVLSTQSLKQIQDWWMFAILNGMILQNSWLFPRDNLIDHLTIGQLNRVLKATAEAVGISTNVSMNTLRHLFKSQLNKGTLDSEHIPILISTKSRN